MTTHEDHEELIKGISEQFKRILESSKQAVYIRKIISLPKQQTYNDGNRC